MLLITSLSLRTTRCHFFAENNLGGTAGDFWQLLVTYDVTGVFSGHWHRYQPSQLGAGGDTWETIIGTGGGWIGFEPIREYQQMHGFLMVEIDGTEANAHFYADEDGDGYYNDLMDSYTMASANPAPTGLWPGTPLMKTMRQIQPRNRLGAHWMVLLKMAQPSTRKVPWALRSHFEVSMIMCGPEPLTIMS